MSAIARRFYEMAEQSLADAEALRDALVELDDKLKGNTYYNDAVQRADELCGEMARHLQWVMDDYTPEQVGL